MLAPRYSSKSCSREGQEMSENELIGWWKTAQQLATGWVSSVYYKCGVKIDADDICDCLVDLWVSKGGEGDEFAETNRGMLYSYVLTTLGHSRDAGMYARSAADTYDDDGAIDEDRLVFFSSSDDEDADDDLDPAERFEKAEMREELGERLEEIEAIRDTWLSAALAEVFETTRRRGQTFAGEIRREKMLPVIMAAAKERGVTAQEVKALAAEIASERRQSVDRIKASGCEATYSEIEAFEQMMGLSAAPATSRTAKTCSRPAKSRRKSALAMPMVPPPQQQSIQLELV